MDLYFAYLEDWFTDHIIVEKVYGEDCPEKGRYLLKKIMFQKGCPTSYVRYDELDTEIYPALSACVSLSEYKAVQALKYALSKKATIIANAKKACEQKLKRVFEEEKAGKQSLPSTRLLTFVEVSKRLNVAAYGVKKLIEAGKLKTSTNEYGRVKVTEESLRKIEREILHYDKG